MNDTDALEPTPAQFGTLHADEASGVDLNLDVILDVPVTLSLEVGRARLPIRNLLQLNQGSVVELERGAGESLDVFVNGTLIAHAEAGCWPTGAAALPTPSRVDASRLNAVSGCVRSG
jgi:flagellar motor switch protein FliN/FliY